MEPIRRIEEGLKELYTTNTGKIERQPDVDIFDTGDSVIIFIDLPGVRKENIKIRVYDRIVEVLSAPTSLEGPGKLIRRERISNFPTLRKIELPFRLRVDSARAVYKDGVLQVIVGKIGDHGVAELHID